MESLDPQLGASHFLLVILFYLWTWGQDMDLCVGEEEPMQCLGGRLPVSPLLRIHSPLCVR